MSATNGNLPDGCTEYDIERAMGYGRRERAHDDLAEAKEWLERQMEDDGDDAA